MYLESTLTGSKANNLYEKCNTFHKPHGLFFFLIPWYLACKVSWENLLKRHSSFPTAKSPWGQALPDLGPQLPPRCRALNPPGLLPYTKQFGDSSSMVIFSPCKVLSEIFSWFPPLLFIPTSDDDDDELLKWCFSSPQQVLDLSLTKVTIHFSRIHPSNRCFQWLVMGIPFHDSHLIVHVQLVPVVMHNKTKCYRPF